MQLAKIITSMFQVFMTPEGKGWGLRTLEDLPKGAFICEYVGEIVTNTELDERNKRSTGERHTYPVLLDADWGSEGVLKDEEALCLDATSYGNVARFINHRYSFDAIMQLHVYMLYLCIRFRLFFHDYPFVKTFPLTIKCLVIH